MAVHDLARIEDKIDRAAAANTEVSVSLGGIRFQNMVEIMEAAKLLAISGPIIPKWLQGNPGGCWAIIIQAVEWKMSPIAVARMSFEANGVVGYMSQMLHAVIEARAPIAQRLRFTYDGDGDTRVCIVTGQIKGEAEPLVLRTPPFSKITPKNSPLWKSDPDQQLSYYGARTWCRRFCPDVLLGIYDGDELGDHVGADRAKDVTGRPSIGDRLPGTRGRRGFSREHVEGEAAKASAPAADPAKADETKPAQTENPAPTTPSAGAAAPASPPPEQGGGVPGTIVAPPQLSAVEIGDRLITALGKAKTVEAVDAIRAEWEARIVAFAAGNDDQRQDQLELYGIIAEHKARVKEGGDAKAVDMACGLRLRRIRERAAATAKAAA